MKALTIRQPWASLCFEPGRGGMAVKWVETRTKPTSYRGPLAIHAGAYRPKHGETFGAFRVDHTTQTRTGPLVMWGPIETDYGLCQVRCHDEGAYKHEIGRDIARRLAEGHSPVDHCRVLPVAAVVGTVDLVDCIPIFEQFARARDREAGRLPPPIGPYLLADVDRCRVFGLFDATGYGIGLTNGNQDDHPLGHIFHDRWDDQAPYGDFTHGRWAWIFANPRKCEPVPAKGKLGLWNWDGGA